MDKKKGEELKIITIKNPNKLISPFHRTHELLISPPRFSIKKEKKNSSLMLTPQPPVINPLTHVLGR
jgi:hypothetical protein